MLTYFVRSFLGNATLHPPHTRDLGAHSAQTIDGTLKNKFQVLFYFTKLKAYGEVARETTAEERKDPACHTHMSFKARCS